MNKYEQLKKVIQEANPEIMELKFGCEFTYQGLTPKYSGSYFVSWVDKKGDIYCSKPGIEESEYFGSKSFEVEGNNMQILGRPIRLADVLLAVDKSYRAKRMAGIDQNRLKVLWQWDLRDDNLDHQGEETKQFLIDLLCGKE